MPQKGIGKRVAEFIKGIRPQVKVGSSTAEPEDGFGDFQIDKTALMVEAIQIINKQ